METPPEFSVSLGLMAWMLRTASCAPTSTNGVPRIVRPELMLTFVYPTVLLEVTSAVALFHNFIFRSYL